MSSKPASTHPMRQHLLQAFKTMAIFATGGIFLAAGFLKITGITQFADEIAAFQLLPTILILPIAFVLPPLEILIGLMVWLPPTRRAGLLLTMLLTFLFILLLLSAEIRGLEVGCGCFGAWALLGKTPIQVIIRDLVILSLAAWLWFCNQKPPLTTLFPTSIAR